ncbi:MAG: YHYH protein [Tepidisphaeraceae bacterium]|jgi:hypothetical protein
MSFTRLVVLISVVGLCCSRGAAQTNLFTNPDFALKSDGKPVGFELSGDASYRYLGEGGRDWQTLGVALRSAKSGSAGALSQVVRGIDAAAGRWFRFTVRGLPQDDFAVADNDLYMKVEFFGENGKISYDEKAERFYPEVEQARRDMTVNGVRHEHGAAAWHTYQLDFYLPFPQVDQLRVSVGFAEGAAKTSAESDFLVNEFSLVRIPDPPGADSAAPHTAGAVVPSGKLIPLGGRWFYDAPDGVTAAPAVFDHTNADRLLYHDNVYSAPFAGNMTATLRAGEMDLLGNIVTQDRPLLDNVTVTFDATAMIMHTHGIPNHPTGKFPNYGFGDGANPNYIQEKDNTYYIPLNPTENPRHIATTLDNSNHALPMGPIGVAVNGVVFFNPFDAGSEDATDLMDLCCGHPAPDYQYHYHKYPICINSPWADNGQGPSPLIGWAFDGFPIYGPYEAANVMAKDVTGEHALNAFNIHYDNDRGWHYNVTPGKFPYIIGGYWGTEDRRDTQGPPRGMRGGFGGPGGPAGPGGPGRGPPPPPPWF